MASPEQNLMRFLVDYMVNLKEHIAITRSQLDAAVEQAMELVNGFSRVSETKKSEADAMMEKAYFSPDDDLVNMMNYTQRSADVVFDLVQTGASERLENKGSELRDTANDMRIMSGIFSKHMESMSRIEDETRDIVLSMVGSLSNGDVLKQKLDNIGEAIFVFSEQLRKFADDFPEKMSHQEISTMKDAILEETFRRYCSEEEKVEFKLVFGPPPHVQRAYRSRAG